MCVVESKRQFAPVLFIAQPLALLEKKIELKKKHLETPKKNFILNPTKKHLILFTSLWLLGITLSTLSMTDLFTESFFQKKYVMTYFSLIVSTITIGVLYFFYWRNKKLNSHSTID